MFNRFFCTKCNEEFDLELRPTENPADFIACLEDQDCLGLFLENHGQIRLGKNSPKFKDEYDY